MPDDAEQATGSPFDPLGLAQTTPRSLTYHPAVIYLASLSEGSRRTVFRSLDTIAAFLSGGRLSVFELDWAALRYEHTEAVRVFLAGRYRPSTANRMLSAMRQVLYQAWILGYMSERDYFEARAVSSIPAGHDLAVDERR